MKPLPQPIRNCPFCRIAMVGSRSNSASASFDTFRCLQCDTTIDLDRSDDVVRAKPAED